MNTNWRFPRPAGQGKSAILVRRNCRWDEYVQRVCPKSSSLSSLFPVEIRVLGGYYPSFRLGISWCFLGCRNSQEHDHCSGHRNSRRRFVNSKRVIQQHLIVIAKVHYCLLMFIEHVCETSFLNMLESHEIVSFFEDVGNQLFEHARSQFWERWN